MRKWMVVLVLVIAAGAGYFAFGRHGSTAPAEGAGKGKGAPGAFAQPPMTVELTKASRAALQQHVAVVGSLVGAATVEIIPRATGRVQEITVRIGDPVRRGQRLATVEDRELREQLRQAQASFEVARATIRQREADLSFAKTNLDRTKSLFDRNLLPRQTLDDAEARYQAAQAQLDLAQAQLQQASSRQDELQINLSNTIIQSPVDGFVAKRYVDQGAYVSPSVPLLSVVDISIVRLLVNLVERDLRKIDVGATATVNVDAYPGEVFKGRVARMAPVLDPATRTAEMEVEIPNPSGRLKPGMYARVLLLTDEKSDALVVPKSAVVDTGGRKGVFLVQQGQAVFRPVQLGIEEENQIEITDGLEEGEAVVTIGASGLRDGSPVLLPGQGQGGGAKSGAPKGASGAR